MLLLHYFNPGHEASVLLGSACYTPPANVRRMQRELAALPVWYADAEDAVWVEQEEAPGFFAHQPEEWKPFATILSPHERTAPKGTEAEWKAMPWGLSPHSVRLFTEWKEKGQVAVEPPVWKEEYVFLTSRRAAAVCLEKLHDRLPGRFLPEPPRFCRQVEDIEAYLLHGEAPFIVKTPFSSSGRGLLWVEKNCLTPKERQWIEGAIRRQGAVSIEHRLEKTSDFALEFYSDGRGGLRYEGVSLFATEGHGSYTGNILQSQETLNRRIAEEVGTEALDEVRRTLGEVLKEMYAPLYTGYVGVDLLVYRRPDGSRAIHPCVEINMRYTMGMVALRLFQKYLHPAARGDFRISYQGKAGEAYRQHRAMQTACPLELEHGRIVKGYLALCPVTQETRYRAYLQVY